MTHPALPDLAFNVRRLLEVVQEACGPEGRWRWLAGPLALLMWFRTRRERREAAEAIEAMKGLLQGFLGLLEELQAGQLPECAEPPVQATEEERAPTPALPRFAGLDREADQRANCSDGAVAQPSPRLVRSAAQSPIKGEGEGARIGAAVQWIPAFAGMTGTVSFAGMTGTVSFAGVTGTCAIAAWTRPPKGLLQKAA